MGHAQRRNAECPVKRGLEQTTAKLLKQLQSSMELPTGRLEENTEV